MVKGYQAGSGNFGRRILRVVKKLKAVVCRMDNERWGANGSYPLIGHRGLVVKGDAGVPRRNRSHIIDHLIDQGSLLCRETRDHRVADAHQPHQPLAEKLPDNPVEQIESKDRRQRIAFLIRLCLTRI